MTYALAIYLLNQFIGFISPKFDPEMEEALMAEEGKTTPPTPIIAYADIMCVGMYYASCC